ncbi:iron chaperone [Demequina litorisediminis]|uniref:YdhG-like domain-containing protein n=1 Tax=Demequina litorisediminis TaxID=1849022 RepID=A0ABQ6IDW4_9MICO|nr:hypothetical protein GCM10025876_11080 [Demequina litorisediminis]
MAKVAEMPDAERLIAERIHSLVTAAAPDLEPRTWYGMPAWAKDGKVLCFFQPATKFESRYSTFGFQDVAALDDGVMWPASFALTALGPAEEKQITEPGHARGGVTSAAPRRVAVRTMGGVLTHVLPASA